MSTFMRHCLFDCTNLVAVITGGGTGMGLMMARALEANGAKVYIIGRRIATLESAASTAQHGRIIPIQGDVTSKPDLHRIAQFIASDTGYVNLVIANAGTVGPDNTDSLCGNSGRERPSIQEVQRVLWDAPMEEQTDVYNVNVNGVLYTAVAFLDLLDKGNKKGNVAQTSQILVTSSMCGIGQGLVHWARLGLAYTTSKAAVNLLTKSLADLLMEYRIRVNAIAPETPAPELVKSRWRPEGFALAGGMKKEKQPLERLGRDEEMAGTVLYFASEAGAYCSGSIHLIDGEMMATLPGAGY